MREYINIIKKNPIIIIFIAIELLLYLLFMCMDLYSLQHQGALGGFLYDIALIKGISPSMLKYYGILLCFVFSLCSYIETKEKARAFLTVAMLFTVISDYFLLLHPEIIVPGLFTFCIAQSIYLYVITGGDKKKTGIFIGIRIIIAIAGTIVLKVSDIVCFDPDQNMNAVLFLGILYALSFLGNVGRLIVYHVRKKEDKVPQCLFKRPGLFLIGLLLFVLCDINVLICNMDRFILITSESYYTLRYAATVLMWGFYLPSQVIIVLSA